MQNNSILNKAKYSENTDEWYTDYSAVSHHIEQLQIHITDRLPVVWDDYGI